MAMSFFSSSLEQAKLTVSESKVHCLCLVSLAVNSDVVGLDKSWRLDAVTALQAVQTRNGPERVAGPLH